MGSNAATDTSGSPRITGAAVYLFGGSPDAARRAAALYSRTRTCARYGVPPLPDFTDVLTTLASGWKATRLEELLPHRWHALASTPETARGP